MGKRHLPEPAQDLHELRAHRLLVLRGQSAQQRGNRGGSQTHQDLREFHPQSRTSQVLDQVRRRILCSDRFHRLRRTLANRRTEVIVLPMPEETSQDGQDLGQPVLTDGLAGGRL